MDVDNREAMHVWGQGPYGKSCTFTSVSLWTATAPKNKVLNKSKPDEGHYAPVESGPTHILFATLPTYNTGLKQNFF